MCFWATIRMKRVGAVGERSRYSFPLPLSASHITSYPSSPCARGAKVFPGHWDGKGGTKDEEMCIFVLIGAKQLKKKMTRGSNMHLIKNYPVNSK